MNYKLIFVIVIVAALIFEQGKMEARTLDARLSLINGSGGGSTGGSGSTGGGSSGSTGGGGNSGNCTTGGGGSGGGGGTSGGSGGGSSGGNGGGLLGTLNPILCIVLTSLANGLLGTLATTLQNLADVLELGCTIT